MIRKIHLSLLYLSKPRWDTNITPPELLDFIQNHPPGRAMDLGCGTGTNVITLAKHGWQATGVDFVPLAIYAARRKARQSNVQVEFHLGDVTHLDYLKTPFELILDIGCLHTLSAKQKTAYLQNIQKLLAPQGTYLLYTFINNDHDTYSSGLTAEDFQGLESMLKPVWRKDGSDHHQIPSFWLAYEHY